MLCSISAGKPGSKWLERLRSSKGFPAGNDIDLEQFLNHLGTDLSNYSDSNLSDANIGRKLISSSAETTKKLALGRKQSTESPRGNGEKEWFGVMSSVLAELFNMGNSDVFPRIHGTKSSRKQPKPKICILLISSIRGNESEDRQRNEDVSGRVASAGDNNWVETKETGDPLRLTEEENVDADIDGGSVDVEEEEKSHADLSAFSRTEVTVIDSSYPSWKRVKLLFRRKNLWRVREKKSKLMNIRMKKRKAHALEDGNAGGEKKSNLYGSSKDVNGVQRTTPLNK
ncbi:hypothetical protein U1Q18_031855, partial [Sarracenia purpurea var. burkii]